MEFASLFSSPFALLLTTLIVIGVVKVVSLFRHAHFFWSKKDVPHIPYSLSFFKASWKVVLRRISLPDWCQYLYNYFPDTKFYGVMRFKPLILLRDPDLIRDITIKDFEYFPHHRNFSGENVEPLLSKNVFALRGDQWREMRNTLSPSFTASKMKSMFELISKCSNEFVDYLIVHPELCSSIETKQVFRRYTTDVIATAAFGINVNSMKDHNNEFYTKGVEVIKFLSGGPLSMLKLVILQVFPRLAKLLGIRFFSPSTVDFFKRIVNETIKMREEQGIVRPDMIHLLMQARDKDSTQKMTLDDIVSQAFIFFFAGFETSATLMCFIAHELACNPDIQDRLRDEVDRHLAEGNGEISYESMTKMVYMDMVVSETLRKYPPTILNDRVCSKRYELPPSQPGRKSVIVEPDTVLVLPIYGLHHDPKYFPNPDKFDPERFSGENKNKIHSYAYLPFGLGPRKCIGDRFALMETKLLIAHLLQKFILKPTEKTINPVVFDTKDFAMQPIGGFWISLEKRESQRSSFTH